MDEPERMAQDDLEGLEASVLPAREAMSLISPDSSSSVVPPLDVPAAPDQATGGPVADAGGSGSGESVTSGDRSDHISNQDTATSET